MTLLADPRPTTSDATASPGFRRCFALGVGAFLVSRLCLIAAAAVRASQVTVDVRTACGAADPSIPCPEVRSPFNLMTTVFTTWDGEWYLSVVRNGYPASVPADVTYFDLEARAAFFPGFPALVRAVDLVLPRGDTFAFFAVTFALSIVAIWLLGVLAIRLFDTEVATRAMILFSVFPGSFVLSYAYAEGLFIVLALACLLLLHDQRWVLAGIFAALGTATRPNGVALVAACAVAAGLAIAQRREWRALAAPALSPIGVVAFHLYLWWRTDEWGVWFRVQREAWNEGISFGATAVTNTLDFLRDPFASPTAAITAFTVATMVFMLWCLRQRPLPWAMMTYVAVVIVMMLIPHTVTARPRFLFTAFPLFISVAAWWPRRDRYAWDLTLVASAGGLVALVGLFAAYGVIP